MGSSIVMSYVPTQPFNTQSVWRIHARRRHEEELRYIRWKKRWLPFWLWLERIG